MTTQATATTFKSLTETQIVEFQKILGVLNRYYNIFSSKDKEPKSNSVLFREKLEKTTPSQAVVSLSKINKYSYIVRASIGDESAEWVHVDGIQEERDELAEKNITEHPVYNITCLTDLYTDKI